MCAPSIAIPQSVSYHSWKFPLADREKPAARAEISTTSRSCPGASGLPWKTHLASAQMSDLASHLSDLIFLEDAADAEVALSKPAILSKGGESASSDDPATLLKPVSEGSPDTSGQLAYAQAA